MQANPLSRVENVEISFLNGYLNHVNIYIAYLSIVKIHVDIHSSGCRMIYSVPGETGPRADQNLSPPQPRIPTPLLSTAGARCECTKSLLGQSKQIKKFYRKKKIGNSKIGFSERCGAAQNFFFEGLFVFVPKSVSNFRVIEFLASAQAVSRGSHMYNMYFRRLGCRVLRSCQELLVDKRKSAGLEGYFSRVNVFCPCKAFVEYTVRSVPWR